MFGKASTPLQGPGNSFHVQLFNILCLANTRHGKHSDLKLRISFRNCMGKPKSIFQKSLIIYFNCLKHFIFQIAFFKIDHCGKHGSAVKMLAKINVKCTI